MAASIHPSIDTGYFPNTPSDWFWSSSPGAGSSYGAWFVGFFSGSVNWNSKGNGSGGVRLVRAGQ